MVTSHLNGWYGVGPAAAATVSVVLKVLPDVLDVGIVLQHRAGLTIYASV